MQTKHLEYLIKVVDCGSVTKAAEELFISQPSLTKAIKNLENEFNIRIFQRESRGVALTPRGRDFVHYARGVLAATNVLERNFVDEQSSTCSRLFVASQQIDFIYEICAEIFIQNKEKSWHYNLVETDRSDVVRQVLDGLVNVGILVKNDSDAKSFLWHMEGRRLEMHSIAKGGVFICVGPNSPLYERESVTFDDTMLYCNVVLDMEARAKQNLCFDNQGVHFNLSQVVFVNTVSACENLLLKTDSICFVSPWTFGCFKSRKLRFIPLIENGSNAEVNELIWVKRAHEPLTPTEMKLINLICEKFNKPLLYEL